MYIVFLKIENPKRKIYHLGLGTNKYTSQGFSITKTPSIVHKTQIQFAWEMEISLNNFYKSICNL